jgi:hypothetical protein
VAQVRISPDPGPASAQDKVAGSWEHRFVAALASKDTAALLSMFAAEIDFCAMTPGRVWEARTGEQAVTDVMLGMWFAPDDVIEQVETIESGLVGHRRRLGYRLVVANPGGRFVVEQQAYLEITDGKITWLRLVSSGFVPLTS